MTLLEIKLQLSAVKQLKSHLGIGQLLNLLSKLVKKQKLGEPWKKMGPPIDNKDKYSKDLIGDAIILYDLLKNDFEHPNALEIVKDVILHSSVTQLKGLVPIIKKDVILGLSGEKRKEMVISIIEQFKNTDWELKEINEDGFTYIITRCRLVDLVQNLGYHELSDAFCPGDAKFFNEYQPDLVFNRPCKYADSNSETCEFQFKLK